MNLQRSLSPTHILSLISSNLSVHILTHIHILILSNVQVQREHHLPAGDFPHVEHFKETLSGYNIDKFEKLKPKMIQSVDDMLGYDIPNLLKNFRNPYD